MTRVRVLGSSEEPGTEEESKRAEWQTAATARSLQSQPRDDEGEVTIKDVLDLAAVHFEMPTQERPVVDEFGDSSRRKRVSDCM